MPEEFGRLGSRKTFAVIVDDDLGKSSREIATIKLHSHTARVAIEAVPDQLDKRHDWLRPRLPLKEVGLDRDDNVLDRIHATPPAPLKHHRLPDTSIPSSSKVITFDLPEAGAEASRAPDWLPHHGSVSAFSTALVSRAAIARQAGRYSFDRVRLDGEYAERDQVPDGRRNADRRGGRGLGEAAVGEQPSIAALMALAVPRRDSVHAGQARHARTGHPARARRAGG
jgi:hypothetical protein